jgi:hypothetical protein
MAWMGPTHSSEEDRALASTDLSLHAACQAPPTVVLGPEWMEHGLCARAAK